MTSGEIAIVLFDAELLIWIQRGNHRAAALVERDEERFISVLTYMELLQGAKEKRQHEYILDFLHEFSFRILPLSENIGHRAAIYIEEYSLSHGLRTGDAIVAATATENGLTLCSSNVKHYKPIKELKLRVFKL
jgi:predicted nucleic acid-binding protein